MGDGRSSPIKLSLLKDTGLVVPGSKTTLNPPLAVRHVGICFNIAQRLQTS